MCHFNCKLPKIKAIFTFIIIREQLIVIISKNQNNLHLHHHQSAVVERTESLASASTANAPNAPAATNEVSFVNMRTVFLIVSIILKIIIYMMNIIK